MSVRALWCAGVFALALAGCERRASEAPAPAGVPPVADATGWVLRGAVAESLGGDPAAVRLSGIASVHSDSITSVALSFQDARGAPAGMPPGSRVEFRPEARILRVHLPATVATWSFTDERLRAGLVSRAFVVRRLDQTIALDLHLDQPVRARARYGDAAAPLTLDLVQGGAPLPPPAPTRTRVVVLWPREQDADDTLRVEGYARTFEANVQIRRRGGAPLDTFTTAADYIETWGEFRLNLPRGPRTARDTLLVGESSAEDGTWQGVSIPLSPR